MLTWSCKDPTEITDYDIDWSTRLAVGDSIVASVWTFPLSSVLVKQLDAFNSDTTKVFLSGGSLNQTYVLTNTITTALGFTLLETVSIAIKAK
jgi:hypothetical protein